MPAPFSTPVAISVPFDNSTNGFTADEVQSAIEEARDTAPGQTARFAIIAGFKGNANTGKYLEVFQSVPSSSVPFVMAEPGDLKALSVAVKTSATATFTVYKNAVSLTTISLTAQTSNFVSGLNFALVAGDKLSYQVTAGAAQDVIFSTFIQVAI